MTRSLRILVPSILVAALVPFACGGESGQQTTSGAGANTGSGGATSSTSTTATPSTTGPGTGGDLGIDAGSGGSADAGCTGDDPAPLDAGLTPPTLAAEFDAVYRVFDLGPVPGMPPGHLGGCVIKQGDPSTLLVAGASESPTGALYSIQVKRNQCGHIIGFEGTATPVAQTPYIDANLLYGAGGVLLYTQWPVNQVSQLLPGAAAPAVTTDLGPLGVPQSVSGLGFVPPNLPAAGGLRTVTWSGGNWFHLDLAAASGGLYAISNPTQTTLLPNGPGGFAYVPEGSPGFPKQSLIVAEWSNDTVGVYEVDDQGDPVVATRRPFFTSFTKPWGAYFEPETGDYLFLTWGPAPDRVYVVQGFTVPPPPPPPPG